MSVGNGVFVVSNNEGRQLITKREYSSGIKSTKDTKDAKISSGLELTVRPTYDQLFDTNI